MNFGKVLDKIEVQFLCCYPVNSIDWQEIPQDLSWDDQKLLIDRTFNNDLNKNYPINVQYQLNFLKKLIQHLEQSCDEVHDEVYEAFCKLQSAGEIAERFSYKHYSLPKYETVISLKESRSFAVDGTTGLCSWQASLALSDWLMHNVDVVQGKSVIELGSGTGLCGFIVSKCCAAEKVILTDGSPVVIDVLNTNRKLNFPDDDAEEKISIVHLPWEACELIQTRKFDVILAADVVYDSTEFDNLINAIDHLFRLRDNEVKLVLAATVRNKATLEKFLSMLESKNFETVTEKEGRTEDSNLFWDRSTQVKIMTVSRNVQPNQN